MHVIDVLNLRASETCITNARELAGLSTCFYLDSEHMKRRLYEKEINKMIRNGLFSLLCLHFQICDKKKYKEGRTCVPELSCFISKTTVYFICFPDNTVVDSI